MTHNDCLTRATFGVKCVDWSCRHSYCHNYFCKQPGLVHHCAVMATLAACTTKQALATFDMRTASHIILL